MPVPSSPTTETVERLESAADTDRKNKKKKKKSKHRSVAKPEENVEVIILYAITPVKLPEQNLLTSTVVYRLSVFFLAQLHQIQAPPKRTVK